MKSYFAKLAARATLANVPVSAPESGQKTDPFEEATQTPSTFPTPAARPVLPTDDSNKPGARRISSPEQLHAPSERIDAAPVEARETSPVTPLVPATEHESKPDPHRPLPVIPETVTQLIPPAEPASVAPPRVEKTEGPVSHQDDDSREELAELHREQAILLRKADAFMGRILKRHEEPVSARQTEGELERPTTTGKREPGVEQPTRLAPAPPKPPVAESDADRASLLIGKLTVEVMPPSLPPIPPPRQIVVVRESRSPRTALPSSRRFGLGQF